MAVKLLFGAGDALWAEYETPLRTALDAAGLDYHLSTHMTAEEVDYIIYAPGAPLQDFTPFTRCKAVLNLWAGVEKITGNTTLTQPLVRMVGGGLTESMVDYVVGYALRYHLGMDAYVNNPTHEWEPVAPPLARERRVAVLGIGALGMAVAEALAGLGFQMRGWSRQAKPFPLGQSFHGAEGLSAALTGADICVLLLPHTPETENTLNAETLALMAKGACVINPGRGPLIDDEALLAALDSGQIGQAVLDVFCTEPLPKDHPYWAHPSVTVTPHIAAQTRPDLAAEQIAHTIKTHEGGQPLQNVVDRSAGY